MSDLFCLTYHSRIVWRDGAMRTDEVRRILDVSRRNNARDNVTGALLLTEGSFVQVLEGQRRAVQHTFDRILQDARHSDITVLQMTSLHARFFSGWSMSFVEGETAPDGRHSAAVRGLAAAEISSQTLLNFFVSLMLRQAGRTWDVSHRQAG